MAASTARVLSRVMPAVLVILAIIGVVTRQYSLTIVALAFAAVIHFNR